MKKAALILVVVLLLLISVGFVATRGGFDSVGYNYKAKVYNGQYCGYDRISGGDFCDVSLQMKWNDAFMDEHRVRHDGYSSYVGSGAWLTNHDFGVDEDGNPWSYFVRIQAKSDSESGCGDDKEVWDDFCIVQEITTGNPPQDFIDGDNLGYPR